MLNKVRNAFRQHFPGDPLIIRSPGRVNLIGEHTDYNEGFVLPAAVDKSIYLALAPRKDDRCRLFAVDLKKSFESRLSMIRKAEARWPNYLLGVVDQLRKAGVTPGGFDCAFGGDIPIGAGMSSSAAIEGGLAFGLNEVFRLGIDKLTLVRLAQKAENEFVGVRCGIMDQFINLFGQAQRVVKLDCRSLEFAYYPFERADARIVLCDTGVRRSLATSEYNVRRQQCESGVTILQRHDARVRALRDATEELLEGYRGEFDAVVFRRCAYVVRENERVLSACNDLERGDFESFGRRMFESHRGLRDEYEVSSPELDLCVDVASRSEGVMGARMMGAGFGGCTINLIEEGALNGFSSSVSREYRTKYGRDVKLHVSRITAGTGAVLAEESVV